MYIPFLFCKHNMIPFKGSFFFIPPHAMINRGWRGPGGRIQIGDDNSNIYSLFSQQLTSRKEKIHREENSNPSNVKRKRGLLVLSGVKQAKLASVVQSSRALCDK